MRLVETPKFPRQNGWAHKHFHESRDIVSKEDVPT